jgi:putative transposase
MQQALRDLQSAFARYASGLAKHPAFKRKGERAAARYTKAGFRLINHRDLYIAKLGKLRLRWDRNLPAYPSSLTLIREATGRYLVSFVVDVMQVTLPRTFRSVGIDFGLSRLATLSTGDYFSNPRHLRKYAGRLAMLQRRTRRKQKRSQRLLKARQAIARCHAKVANARKDTLNKLTTLMVRRYDTICIEDLNLRGMVKNQVLARSLHDAGIGMAIRMLEEKAERYGKCVVRVDRFFPSSKTCSECGFVAKSMPLSIRQWQCAHCGTSHDRDENAARNILAAGQAVAAHGDRVRTA